MVRTYFHLIIMMLLIFCHIIVFVVVKKVCRRCTLSIYYVEDFVASYYSNLTEMMMPIGSKLGDDLVDGVGDGVWILCPGEFDGL